MECPICRTPLDGANLIDTSNPDENTYIEVYLCPECGEEPMRVYEFVEWKNKDEEIL